MRIVHGEFAQSRGIFLQQGSVVPLLGENIHFRENAVRTAEPVDAREPRRKPNIRVFID